MSVDRSESLPGKLQQVTGQEESVSRTELSSENTRVAEEDLRLLLKINNAVVSELSLRELIHAVAASVREALQPDLTGISLYDPETNLFRAYMFDLPNTMPPIPEGTPMPLVGTIGGIAFTTGQPVFMNRPDPDMDLSEFDQRLMDGGIRSGGVIPLIAHGHKLGFLGVGSFRENAFSPADQDLLWHIANQIALAIENSLHYEQIKQDRDRFEKLLEVSNAVSASLDLRDLLQTTSALLKAYKHHDVSGISLYEEESGMFRVLALNHPTGYLEEGVLLPIEGTPDGLAFKTRKAVWRERLDPAEFHAPIIQQAYEAGLRSGCSIPLISRDRVIGVLALGSYRESSITQDDIEMLQLIAGQIAGAVENALQYRQIGKLKDKLASEKLYLEDEIRTEHNFDELIGTSRTFKRILKQIETVAPTDSAVLIRGETGTGKELIARAVHNLSGRREHTLVKVNCAAIPMGLLESELFGHEKGAFTGAITQRIGRFELAHRGTLFLDEVGDIPLELQPKLLRVLQEQEFERLGSPRTQRVDVRLIAATNCDLEQMVTEKKYRSDLFYRLNVFPVSIPPLRERAEDIPILARFFTQKYARRMKKRIESIPAESMAALTSYPWPGNVRELEHFIERAVVLTQGADLEISQTELKPPAGAAPAKISTLETAEREHIRRALEETDWVIGGPNGAAARLGMKRTTLQSRMQKLGISRQS